MPIERRRFVIRGRVQRVGFRYFTERAAVAVGVSGNVHLLTPFRTYDVTTDPRNITLLGSATIAPSSESLLRSIADVAKGCEGVRIAVAGHTDSTGNANSNLELSQARAEAVAAYLTDDDFPEARISARGFGSRGRV